MHVLTTLALSLLLQVALWRGDAATLRVDAFIIGSNERLDERSGTSARIAVAAGPQLQPECTRLGGCAVGGAFATGGFALAARSLIHAALPVWVSGVGVEALEQCNTAALAMGRQLHCATLAVAPLRSVDAPRAHAALATVRALRRFLELDGAQLRLVLLVTSPQEEARQLVEKAQLAPRGWARSGRRTPCS